MSESNRFTVNTAAERTELLRRKFKGRLSDRICPRCQNGYTIDKPNRQCHVCKGRVLWAGYDDGKFAEETNEYCYIWWKSTLTNICGWYPAEFFKLENRLYK